MNWGRFSFTAIRVQPFQSGLSTHARSQAAPSSCQVATALTTSEACSGEAMSDVDHQHREDTARAGTRHARRSSHDIHCVRSTAGLRGALPRRTRSITSCRIEAIKSYSGIPRTGRQRVRRATIARQRERTAGSATRGECSVINVLIACRKHPWGVEIFVHRAFQTAWLGSLKCPQVLRAGV